MRKTLIAIVVMLASMLLLATRTVIAGSPKPPFTFGTHVVAACDTQPEVISVRAQNLMTESVTVTGEIWAQPNGEAAVLISAVPVQFQSVVPGSWGGPEERVGNVFPEGFAGTVWGWAQVAAADGTVIGKVELPFIQLECGNGGEASASVEFAGQVLAVCDTDPNTVSVRLQNLMTTDLNVTGELWSKHQDNQATLISSVPSPHQNVTPENWGGPEERMSKPYPAGFDGKVWGWAEIRSNGNLQGRVTLDRVPLSCRNTLTFQLFLPMIKK